MLKRLVLALIPITFAIIMFYPIENRFIYYGLYFLMMFWALIYHLLDDDLSIKALEKKLKRSDFFSLKAGYIFMDGQACILTKGRFVISEGNILFYKREHITNAKLVYSFPVESVLGYTLKKVDEFHEGITFTVEGEKDEVRFTGKEFRENEKEIIKLLGWNEE